MSTGDLQKLEVDLSKKRSKSLLILQRMGNQADEIVHETVHTAVFRFNFQTNQFEKEGIEGGLFITRSNVAPYFSAVVLNKANPNNFVVHLDTIISVKQQESYIMLRYVTGGAPVIMSLWIHDNEERSKMGNAIIESMERIKAIKNGANPGPGTSSKTDKLKGLLAGKFKAEVTASAPAENESTKALKGLLKGKSAAQPMKAAPAPAPAPAPAHVFSGANNNKGAALLGMLKKEPAPAQPSSSSSGKQVPLPPGAKILSSPDDLSASSSASTPPPQSSNGAGRLLLGALNTSLPGARTEQLHVKKEKEENRELENGKKEEVKIESKPLPLLMSPSDLLNM